MSRGSGAGGDVVVWPHDHSVEVLSSGGVRVRGGNGDVVAKVGDDVSVGEGEVGDRGIEFVAPASVPSKKELLERCPGRYYPAGGEIRVVEDSTTGR